MNDYARMSRPKLIERITSLENANRTAAAGSATLSNDPGAVVQERDEAVDTAMRDPQARLVCARMAPRVREAFLHDPEHFDLLIGGEVHGCVDLELDLELSVCRQEVDIAA